VSDFKGQTLYFTGPSGGKGFVTHRDRNQFKVRALPAEVYIVDDNSAAKAWAKRNSLDPLTALEARKLVHDLYLARLAAYNNDTDRIEIDKPEFIDHFG